MGFFWAAFGAFPCRGERWSCACIVLLQPLINGQLLPRARAHRSPRWIHAARTSVSSTILNSGNICSSPSKRPVPNVTTDCHDKNTLFLWACIVQMRPGRVSIEPWLASLCHDRPLVSHFAIRLLPFNSTNRTVDLHVRCFWCCLCSAFLLPKSFDGGDFLLSGMAQDALLVVPQKNVKQISCNYQSILAG